MTNAEKYAQDIDKLVDVIYKSDEFDVYHTTYDEKLDEYVGCIHEGEKEGCRQCIKAWLQEEAMD